MEARESKGLECRFIDVWGVTVISSVCSHNGLRYDVGLKA